MEPLRNHYATVKRTFLVCAVSVLRHPLDRWLSGGARPVSATLVGWFAIVMITAGFGLLDDRVGTAPKALALVLPVIGASALGGRRAALAVAVAATLAFSVLVPPYGSITVRVEEDLIALGVFLVVAVLTTAIVARRIELLQEVERQGRTLLRSVSHDLRTPLAAIRAAASELDSDAAHTAEERHRLLAHVQRETERLDRLVANLLDLGRIEAAGLEPQRVPVDLSELVDASWMRLAPLFPGSSLEVRIADDARSLDADPTLLDQLLTNLLENAARHGGDAAVKVDVERGDGNIVITVADDGPGVAGAVRDEVFEPFRSAGSSSGQGVGLAICRAIAHAHGGAIELSRATDHTTGATFVVRLPG